MKLFLFLAALFITSTFSDDYGTKQDSLPNWQERALLVLTNTCRMNPQEYRDTYIQSGLDILLPQNYPSVDPLYWNYNLNNAARDYANIMADANTLSHELEGKFSTRLSKYYSGRNIGENIAYGYQDPFAVMIGWICETSNPSNAVPDGVNDGHRRNIMSSGFNELGCGYTRSVTVSDRGHQRITHWWCQDFGGGNSKYSYHPIPAASHFFTSDNEITFMANCFSNDNQITSVSLVIDNSNYNMELHIGEHSRGTYILNLPLTSKSRNYYFLVELSDKSTARYPESGMLVTYGEGNSEKDFTSDSETNTLISDETPVNKNPIRSCYMNGKLILSSRGQYPSRTDIFDCSGRKVFSLKWNFKRELVENSRFLSGGVFILAHNFNDGSFFVEKLNTGY